ncbi:hypothetical protein [Devosia sp.]|uniref:hypothetical protein n=1 Tax=Devosia sp. TaxID=1871048 RepID=UPI0035B409CD
MHLFRLTVAATLGLLAALPARADPVALTPEQVGQIFCISRVGNDMAAVSGLLTPDLASAIAQAEAADAAWAAANPGDKPPLGDGIPWQSYPDYAAVCTAGAATLMMDEASVAITYAFPEWPDAGFTDHLQLRLVDSPALGQRVWRIDNLAYGTEGDLRTSLRLAFMP